MKRSILAFLAALPLPVVFGEVVAVPHPGEALPEQNTVVWTPLFQAVWDTYNSKAGGKPVRVDPPNDLMNRLDSFQWKADGVMPAGSWKTWSGPPTPEFLATVNSEAAGMTGEASGPFDLKDGPESRWVCFGLLDREVEFRRAFSASLKTPMNFRTKTGNHPVRFFGSRDDFSGEFGDSIRVLAWRPGDGSHAIQIRCKQADDTAILYLPPVHQDFTTACRWLRTWREEFRTDPARAGGWNDPLVHANDDIRIPYVTVDHSVDFQPLLDGLRYHGKKQVPWIIGRAEQVTRFQLHEKGAKVRADVLLEVIPFAEPTPPTPRAFIYDRPFFVFLWRDNAEWPYFGAWIGDESALSPFH